MMNIINKTGLIVFAGSLIFSCAPVPKSNGNHGLPPGQVKKVTGSKSAKHYAPGQYKKK